jgi:transglutaminase-like putative cysteine protease
MTYRILHTSTYSYKQAVSYGNHLAYLMPRARPHHTCKSHELRIAPEPAEIERRTDFFGNTFFLFSILEPHTELKIEARSKVQVDGEYVEWPQKSPAWEEVVASLRASATPAELEGYQFVFESPRIRPATDFAQFALQSFTPGRPLTEGLLDMTTRIHREFRFDSKSTDVRTSPEEVLWKRAGVCQDFAHVQVACLRSIGLAARYVSGYLRTYPPPGRPRLRGADASHAWVSVYCPGSGWLDVDPTNNLIPSESHVTLAWGRDYGDVSPVRGVILGGRGHKLNVGVDLEPIDE